MRASARDGAPPARDGAPPARGRPVRPAPRSRVSWLRALPLLAGPVTRTMPWAPLIAGCLAGTAFLAVLTHVAESPGSPPGPGIVRLAFLPAVAALAFVPRAPFRPLTQTTPVPAWVAPAGHLLLAGPVLAVTCWAQLRIAESAVVLHATVRLPAVYPPIAQLTGWCAVTAAAAVCVDRSRYADLGGAVAAPVGLGVIALAWYTPVTARFLTQPSATGRGVTVVWYAIAAAALAVTCVAMRDRWHRCIRDPIRPRRGWPAGRPRPWPRAWPR